MGNPEISYNIWSTWVWKLFIDLVVSKHPEFYLLDPDKQDKLLNEWFASGANPDQTREIAQLLTNEYNISSLNHELEPEEFELPDTLLLPFHIVIGTTQFKWWVTAKEFEAFYKKRWFTQKPYGHKGFKDTLKKRITIRHDLTWEKQTYKPHIEQWKIYFKYIELKKVILKDDFAEFSDESITHIKWISTPKPPSGFDYYK